MILRNVAIRHGRKALSIPSQRSFLRSLSSIETITSEPPSIEHPIDNDHRIPNPSFTGISPLHFTNPVVIPKKDVVKESYIVKQHIKKRTAKLGSAFQKGYEPDSLVRNPPRPDEITLELLMASQSHLGHATSLWNPANQRYIFGIRQGVHIISLEETAAHLRRAAKVVEGVAYHGGLILFIGTRAGQATAIVKAAELAQGCHLFERWIPGTITNGDQLLAKCDLKVLDKDDKEITEGFETKVEEWPALKPDLVVCLDPLENYIMLHECGLNNIPTIGVIDTDADPTWVTYPIPANDDSIRCIQVIAGVLGRAGEEGQKKRLEAAATGTVTWLPPPELGKPEIKKSGKSMLANKPPQLKVAEGKTSSSQAWKREHGEELEL